MNDGNNMRPQWKAVSGNIQLYLSSQCTHVLKQVIHGHSTAHITQPNILGRNKYSGIILHKMPICMTYNSIVFGQCPKQGQMYNICTISVQYLYYHIGTLMC